MNRLVVAAVVLFLLGMGAPARTEDAAIPAKDLTIHLVGHAHIDMNWLWLWPETVDVCKNTFTSAMGLMNEYPDFIFSQSQPAVYLAMQENAPEIFARMKGMVKRGQWDCVATTWTEGDTNMSSGESIVRSILYGKRYMKQHFGVESAVGWEPDTFGHPWTLPQILAKSGIKYYCFMRCGFGEPIFWWESPDGSRILAFNFETYNGDIGEHLAGKAAEFAKKTGLNDFMHVYGVGDHGGGPTRAMLETAQRLKERDDFPRLKYSTVSDYFETVLKHRPKLPVRNTELNFIFEGCYTTHGDIKRWNRECENLLPCAEKFSSIASTLGGRYPASEFEQSWRITGFNQFHDLLCGSAIHGSYDYSRELYEKAASQGKAALTEALATLTAQIDTRGSGIPIVVFNPLAWERTDAVSVASPFPGESTRVKVTDSSGAMHSAQLDADCLHFTARNVPAMGYRVFWVNRAAEPVAGGVTGRGSTVENQFFRVTIDPDAGAIKSIYDKLNARELMTGGKGGALLQVLLEEPHGMSAWFIGKIVGGEDLVGNSEVVLMDSGPARASITFDHNYGSSSFVQELTLYDEVPRIDIRMTADWQEQGTGDKPAPMLKVAFPANLRSPKATFEIPFGSIERPTNGAEVPALKWVDLSEAGYGLSLLNDCKHGFDVNGSTVRATLLRSPYEPDPTPDKGTHEMTYSLYPHKGDWRAAGTVQRGFELNEPLIARVAKKQEGKLPSLKSFLSVSRPNIVVTTLKQAEGEDSLILRFYEAHGEDCDVSISLNLPVKSAIETDLMERPTGKRIPIEDGALRAGVGRHEIKTYKLSRK